MLEKDHNKSGTQPTTAQSPPHHPTHRTLLTLSSLSPNPPNLLFSLFHPPIPSKSPKAVGWEYSVTHPPLTVASSQFVNHLPPPRDEFYRTEQPPWHRMVAHPPHWIIQHQGAPSAGHLGGSSLLGAGGFGRIVRTTVRTTEPYGRIVQFF